MTDLIIAGSIGIDDIETPFGKVESVLGGSSIYASLAASFFAPCGLVSIAGRDLPQENILMLKKRGVDLSGLKLSDKTFRWSGSYEYDMNEAKTLKTELNSLKGFDPKLPENYKNCKIALLGNINPMVQLSILDQIKGKPFIVTDTMNFWIESQPEQLKKVLAQTSLAVINEGEARQLFNTPNLIKAGRELLALGPKYAIIKKGEHGAILFSDGNIFVAPGYPLEEVKDPTGCGDSFAGGLVGYLARQLDSLTANQPVSFEKIRKAVVYGSCIASFCAEEFGTGYINNIKFKDIKERYHAIQKICRF